MMIVMASISRRIPLSGGSKTYLHFLAVLRLEFGAEYFLRGRVSSTALALSVDEAQGPGRTGAESGDHWKLYFVIASSPSSFANWGANPNASQMSSDTARVSAANPIGSVKLLF